MQSIGNHRTLKSSILSFTLIAASAFSSGAFSSEVSHGKMAATIRSADYPCAHVVAVRDSGENAWSVECNSGIFNVRREADGKYTVTKTN